MERPPHEVPGQASDALQPGQVLGGILTSAQLNLIWQNREEARRRREQRAAASPGQSRDIPARGAQTLEHSDDPMCIICRASLRSGEPVLALECGHTVHEPCVVKLSQAKGKEVRDCCPYNCRQRPALVQDDNADADEVAEVPVEAPEAEGRGLSIGEEATEGLGAMGLGVI